LGNIRRGREAELVNQAPERTPCRIKKTEKIDALVEKIAPALAGEPVGTFA
jgi:hypothetical protein